MPLLKLPAWFTITAHLIPWLMCFYFFTIAITNPEQMGQYLVKDSDSDGAGLVENLTVLVLIPGIIAGFYGFWKYRNLMQPIWTSYWLLLWTIACFYFAGEEISWGQWFFQWSTPESFAQINDQNETNLHNISSWFDQKPRTLVELWIFIAGVIMPMLSLFKQKASQVTWQYWTHPLPTLFSAGLFFTITRFSGWMETPELRDLFGSSEVRELCVALFLSLFLISFPVRLNQLKKELKLTS